MSILTASDILLLKGVRLALPRATGFSEPTFVPSEYRHFSSFPQKTTQMNSQNQSNSSSGSRSDRRRRSRRGRTAAVVRGQDRGQLARSGLWDLQDNSRDVPPGMGYTSPQTGQPPELGRDAGTPSQGQHSSAFRAVDYGTGVSGCGQAGSQPGNGGHIRGEAGHDCATETEKPSSNLKTASRHRSTSRGQVFALVSGLQALVLTRQ